MLLERLRLAQCILKVSKTPISFPFPFSLLESDLKILKVFIFEPTGENAVCGLSWKIGFNFDNVLNYKYRDAYCLLTLIRAF